MWTLPVPQRRRSISYWCRFANYLAYIFANYMAHSCVWTIFPPFISRVKSPCRFGVLRPHLKKTWQTLSAIHHSRIQKIVPMDRWNAEASDGKPLDTVLFTPEVINTPARIQYDVTSARPNNKRRQAYGRVEQRATLDAISQDETWRSGALRGLRLQTKPSIPDQLTSNFQRVRKQGRSNSGPDQFSRRAKQIMNSLEQLRSIFDGNGLRQRRARARARVLVSKSALHDTRNSSRGSASYTNLGR